MHTINDGKGSHFKKLVIFPDYTSSGIWCSCGLGLGDPKEELELPHGLIDLIDFWNTYWEMASDEDCNISLDYAQKEINRIGNILSSMVWEQGIPCEFLEDRSKINRIKS